MSSLTASVWKPILVAIAAALAVWLPFHPYASGQDAVLYNALAADVQYYAKMARSFTELGFFSFDHQTVSNGFMPLWQIVTAALDMSHVDGAPPDALLKKMFLTSLLLTGLGVAGLAIFVQDRIGWLATLLVIPLLAPGAVHWLAAGAAGLGALTGQQFSFSIWSFANGMESAAGLALFAIWLPVAARLLAAEYGTPRLAFWAGVLSFLIFMARLDDVFLGVALFLGILMSRHPERAQLARAFVMAPVVGTALYVGANLMWADTPLPLSGAGKTALFSFPSGAWHLGQIGETATYEMRLVPILTALAVGLSVLVAGFGTGRVRGSLIAVLALYLIFKAGFLFTSVPLVHQGYWYYALMIGSVNLIAAIALGGVLARFAPAALLAGASAVAVVLVVLAGRDAGERLSRLNPKTYPFVAAELCRADSETRMALKTVLEKDGALGIIDTGDGVYANCLEMPAFTVTSLADSKATLEGMNRDGFVPFVLAQGHPLIVDSPVEWASYGWETLTEGWDTEPVAEAGPVRILRLVPSN